MREIKFRAWNKKEKQWIGGYCFTPLNWPQFSLNSFELTQFTGLHDKNGKEIYEGDILTSNNEVVYKNDGYWITHPSQNRGIRMRDFGVSNCKIIGNIYESP